MNSKNIYIILTGVHERKVFDLFNILKKHFVQYGLLLFDYKDTSVSLPLVYTRKVHRLPNNSFNEFEPALLASLEPYQGTTLIYIPLLDNYNGLFYRFMEKHPGILTALLPSTRSFETTMNKVMFQGFCVQNQLPVPASFTRKDIPYLKENFRQLIIKPAVGAGSVGISFIENAAGLARLEELDFDAFLVQEKISNINVEGAFFLMQKGELVSYYGHKRIRVFPETGGVTVYSEYHDQPQLKELGADLLKRLEWNGLAMVEFLYDETQKAYRIIEVNPRLWGSFLLSEFANTGFVENYINLCLNLPARKTETRKNTKIRWFYPFDVLLYLKKKGRIEGFWKMDFKNTCYINFTYAGFARAILYMLYFTFNINSIKRFYKKLGSGHS